MKLLKTRKAFALLIVLLFVIIYFRHMNNVNNAFYQVDYPKEDISHVLKKEKLTKEDYKLIFRQTGISPVSAEKLIRSGDTEIIMKLHNLYFRTPEFKREFIAFPVTVCESNEHQKTPLADIQKGDILVTFNTHTLDWRHGHCGMVLDEEKGILLEHMAIGIPSSLTYIQNWCEYPSFAVLRYPDEKIAEKAVDYAKEHLTGIDYNILAGVIKKDKSDEAMPTSSHCSHIIWQAYKAVGADIDSTGGIFVTPENLALSEELDVVQIYGLNPELYEKRILK